MRLFITLFALIFVVGLSTPAVDADSLVMDDTVVASVLPSDASQNTPDHMKPIVVCPSGVGTPICEFRFEDPLEVQVLVSLCGSGALPASVCGTVARSAVAQVPATCPVLVGVSLGYTSEVCGDLERNELCYGYETVTISPSGLLTLPGQVGELTPVTSIEASAYNLRNGEYGISAVNAHANLPLELGDTTGLRFILFGELVMRNRVPSTEAVVLPDASVAVTVNTDSDLFDIPALSGTQTVLGAATTGQTLMADAISVDSAWVRVMFMSDTEIGSNAAAWISAESVDFANNQDIEQLAIIEEDDFTPNQSFFFMEGSTGGGSSSPDCQPGSGSLLFLQAPEGIETQYIANDARLTLIGSAIMQLVEGNTRMQITMLSGVAILHSEEGEDILLPAGFASQIDIVPSQGFYIVAPDAEWDAPLDLTRTEMNTVTYFEGLPVNLLNQAVDVPTCGPDSTGDTCDIEYDYAVDETLMTQLCADGVLSADLSVCE